MFMSLSRWFPDDVSRQLPIAGGAMVVVWIVFKIFYPYADYFADSYSYIQAAANGDVIGYRPIGYSIFLRMVHVVSSSDTFLVTLQYGMVQAASLVLYVRLRRVARLALWAQWVILLFLVLNPVMPYTCNYVSSDALFIALSLLWLHVLMGLILRPGWRGLFVQLALLVMIFNIRYVALYYPAVAAIAFFLMRKGALFRLAGVATSVAVVVVFTSWIRAITKKETGADVFSAFSGWQIANNALHIYPHIPVDTEGLPSVESRVLAGYVRSYFDSAGPSLLGDGQRATTAYMWEKGLPLHRYMAAYEVDHPATYFDTWNRVAVVFARYGDHLVRKHPLAFGGYYVWPSAKSYFITPLDVYAVYNEGRPDVDAVAVKWFGYAGTRVKVASPTVQGKLLSWIPVLYIFLNLGFLLSSLLLLPVRGLRQRFPQFVLCYRLAAAYLLSNAAFCIFASPTVLRYQVLPVILLFMFGICALHFVSSHYGDQPTTDQRRT
ncbi:MAG: hypothetical protein JST42_16855 [Bacteroidetes bacterium]|nr:hypothetical protein [Bacteroidota bacterium]